MKLLNKDQEEQLKEVVAHLRQVRLEKAIRIEEIAAQTHIRLSFLQALEEGKFEALPEPVYVQGFIRHYAYAVGLDGNALAQTTASIFSHQEPDNDRQDVDEKPNIPNISIPLVVPYILLLAVACFGLFYILNPQRSAESLGQKKYSPLPKEQKTVPTPFTSSPAAAPTVKASSPITVPTPFTSSPAAAEPTTTPSPIVNASSPVEVTLELQDQSWLRVKVDGKTEFEGTLNKGERKTWSAQKELTVRSGNAGAVLVSANKKKPIPLGQMGSIKQVTFTP